MPTTGQSKNLCEIVTRSWCKSPDTTPKFFGVTYMFSSMAKLRRRKWPKEKFLKISKELNWNFQRGRVLGTNKPSVWVVMDHFWNHTTRYMIVCISLVINFSRELINTMCCQQKVMQLNIVTHMTELTVSAQMNS